VLPDSGVVVQKEFVRMRPQIYGRQILGPLHVHPRLDHVGVNTSALPVCSWSPCCLLELGDWRSREKQKAPAFIDRTRGHWNSSCCANSALYPVRSITSHRFCGIGRLFPGLEAEMRRAESDIGSNWLRMTRAIPDASKNKVPVSGCQGNCAKRANISRQPANYTDVSCQMDDDIAKCAHFDPHAANMLVGRPRSTTTLLPATRCPLTATCCLRQDRPRLIHGTGNCTCFQNLYATQIGPVVGSG
jgi:hypothetical protein